MSHYEQPQDSSILTYARSVAPAAWGITATTQQGRIIERESHAWLVEFVRPDGRTEQLRVTNAPKKEGKQ